VGGRGDEAAKFDISTGKEVDNRGEVRLGVLSAKI
jgi:hypothetical protein